MLWCWWKTAAEMAEDFARKREPYPDDDFVRDCELPDTPEAQRVCLAVRRSVASYGMVDPLFIRASDRFPEDLRELSGWDSIDLLAWVFELERELGKKPIVTRAVLDDIGVTFTVRDLVWEVYRSHEEWHANTGSRN